MKHKMKRIIMHWTAGSDGANGVEKDAYHIIVGRDGAVTLGDDPILSNIPPLREGRYAAHTRGLNSYSIGIAMDCMAGATERPFYAGTSPMTEEQVTAFCRECARLARDYKIAVTPETILTHAEVQGTLGVPQKQKWDITWLPGMARPDNPITVGNILRKRIEGYL